MTERCKNKQTCLVWDNSLNRLVDLTLDPRLPALQQVVFVEVAPELYRDRTQAIDEIVIHNTATSGVPFETVVRYLANGSLDDGRNVSAHYVIGRHHGEIASLVPEAFRTNHIAAPGHNVRSIGIELVAHEEGEDFSGWQYDAIAQLVYSLMVKYKIPADGVIGHGDVQSNRYGEPDGFVWGNLTELLHDIDKEFGGQLNLPSGDDESPVPPPDNGDDNPAPNPGDKSDDERAGLAPPPNDESAAWESPWPGGVPGMPGQPDDTSAPQQDDDQDEPPVDPDRS